MSADQGPRRTSTAVRQFNVWFGAIFLIIGLVALLIGASVFLSLRGVPGMGNEIGAFLGAPLGVGTVFSLLGGTFMAIGLRRASQERRLLLSGTTGEATVTSVESTNTRINRRRLWHVRYTYTDMIGGVYEGDSGYLSAEEAQSYHVGERTFIRYDPNQASASVWLGRDESLGER
jgi:hypothetical protein